MDEKDFVKAVELRGRSVVVVRMFSVQVGFFF